MKFLIIASCLLACAFAFSAETKVSLTQDTAGNYKLVLHDKDVSREEEGRADGSIQGLYKFADKDGAVHTINFVASKDGYVAQGADIPTSVEESSVISKTRAHQQAVYERLASVLPKIEQVDYKPETPQEVIAKLVVPEISSLPASFVPEEEKDVAEAKKEFLKAFARALDLLKEEYAKL